MTARSAMKGGLALAVLMLLAACGSDTDATAGARVAKGIVAGLVQPARAKVPPPQPSRAQIAGVAGPILLAEIGGAGGAAFLAPVARNGAVETWSTPDDITLSLREGVLVATRGLGQDLMSVSAPGIADIARGAGSHARTHYALDGADRTVRRDYACTLSAEGSETILVLQRSHATRRVTERCAGDAGTFVNRYWFEPSGALRRSEQQIDPALGTVRLSRLQD